MSLSTEQIVEMYASGMTLNEIAQSTRISESTVHYKLVKHPAHKWVVKCHKLSRKIQAESMISYDEYQKEYSRNWYNKRSAKGLCRDCGCEVKPYKRKGPGRQPSGYRCEACNIKRRRKK